MKSYYRILSIAGSDSGGGAGIQADIKAISACGCYAMTALTAVTVQNTLGVSGVHGVPPDIVEAQILCVLDDIGADAVKSGMLFSSDIIKAVARALEGKGLRYILDPVTVATSGDVLLPEEALDAMTDLLFPLAELITPNIPEAKLLLKSKSKIETKEQMGDCAAELAKLFDTAVLLKGGHIDGGTITDVLYDPAGGSLTRFDAPKIETPNTHGTGCTLSAAIAAFAGKGLSMKEAVIAAKAYLDGALAAGSRYSIGKGHGPVRHFFAQSR